MKLFWGNTTQIKKIIFVNCAYLAVNLNIGVDRAKPFVCFILARDDHVNGFPPFWYDPDMFQKLPMIRIFLSLILFKMKQLLSENVYIYSLFKGHVLSRRVTD
jgi:hypothetical protein